MTSMTRDEAIEVCFAVLDPYFPTFSAEKLLDVAAMEVDMFTRLGMLTLSDAKEPARGASSSGGSSHVPAQLYDEGK